jgi:hypothetical protein
MKAARLDGNAGAKAFRKALTNSFLSGEFKPGDFKSVFTHECAYNQWRSREGGPDPEFKDPFFSPDHVHEIQLGGATTAFGNFMMMPKAANEWIGRKLAALETTGPEKHTSVRANCC